MPIYAYRCASCGHAKDVLQKLSDPPLTECPSCGAQAFSKQVTAAGFQLKGSGWYATDFKGDKSAKKSDPGDSGKTEAGKTESGRTEAGKPEPGKPDVAKTDASKPETSKSSDAKSGDSASSSKAGDAGASTASNSSAPKAAAASATGTRT